MHDVVEAMLLVSPRFSIRFAFGESIGPINVYSPEYPKVFVYKIDRADPKDKFRLLNAVKKFSKKTPAVATMYLRKDFLLTFETKSGKKFYVEFPEGVLGEPELEED